MVFHPLEKKKEKILIRASFGKKFYMKEKGYWFGNVHMTVDGSISFVPLFCHSLNIFFLYKQKFFFLEKGISLKRSNFFIVCKGNIMFNPLLHKYSFWRINNW